MLYQGLLHTHNLFRWLVLIVLVLAVVFAVSGWLGNNKWGKRDNFTGLLLTIFMDIQLLIGLILYFFASPLTKAALSNFGAAMKNSELRFYAVEHILLMLIALVLVHIGRSKSKKAKAPFQKHRISVIFYSIALILILVAIPWSRDLF